MPQMYSTLSSNDTRNSDKEFDMSSDFDAYCCESNSELNITNASIKSCTLTDNELDADPEPTDYSQRYKERPIDYFIAPRISKEVTPEVAACEDSVKLYITEGTPLTFSLASSLSYLREASLCAIDEEKTSLLAEIENIDKYVANEPKEQLEEKKSSENIPKNNLSEKIQIETKNVTFVDNLIKNSVPIDSIVTIDRSNENICEETPLMFSRSSSLGSLSDCEIKSDIYQSSVVSEFSGRQSEVVSSSDLPDSPLDSPRPLTPKPNLADNVCENIENDWKKSSTVKENHIQNLSDKLSDNVFEDKPMSLATEGTPALFSVSTSLSSLTEKLIVWHEKESSANKIQIMETPIKTDYIECEIEDIEDNAEIISTSSEDEGEDELLAACISSANGKSREVSAIQNQNHSECEDEELLQK